jgi:hypothetical protein
MELRSKWSRLCQKLHQFKNNNSQFYPSLLGSSFSPKNLNLLHPIWGPCNQNKPMFELHMAPFQTNCPKTWPHEVSPDKEIKTTNSTTNLFLGGLFNLSDSASSESKERRKRSLVEVQELEKRLYENIPWQSGAIASIVEAIEKKENLIFLEGNDQIAKRRVALVVAETYCRSADKVVHVNLSKFDLEIVSKEVEKEKSCVVLIEGINQAPIELQNFIGSLKDQSDVIVILTSLRSGTMLKRRRTRESNGVVSLKFSVDLPSDNDLKRKSPSGNELESEPKRHRGETGLDLNLCVSEDEGDAAFEEEEVIPSDITHEDDGFDGQTELPQNLFQKFGARITIGAGSDGFVDISNRIVARLNRACTDEGQFGTLCVDEEVIEWLVWASGSCLESLFEKWVREVFQTCVRTVNKGGKVRLGLGGAIGAIGGGIEGSEGIVPGFCGSVLPEKIQLD